MAQVSKIDSNITGLAYAEESSLGVLPASPTWQRLEPTGYNDFGGQLATVAPNPINPSRQRKKGVITDLDANGGFSHDLSYENMRDLLQSVMFADVREKGNSLVTETTTATFTASDTDGFIVGTLVKGSNFLSTQNNGLFTVTTVTANTSVSVGVGSLVAESNPPSTAKIEVVGFEAGSGDLEVDVSGSLPALTSTDLDFSTLDIVPGQWIFIGGDAAVNQFGDAANNGFKRVRSVSSDRLTIDKSVQSMVSTSGAGKEIFIFYGDVLRNETGSKIKRRSYHIERTLGAPDTSSSSIQSEVLTGAIPNEMTLNIPTANLATVDLSFVGIDNVQRTAIEGPLQSSVLPSVAGDIFNTSSDFSRLKMAVVSDTDSAPDALFGYITEATINVNNNLSPNKAVGVLGAFDVTAGTFAVGGSVTAYFSNVEAVQAVRRNSDVTLDMAIVKNNQGLVLDIPLLSLGDGRLNVEQDQPITLPLSTDAATGESVDLNLDHTLLFTFFGYLPNLAD